MNTTIFNAMFLVMVASCSGPLCAAEAPTCSVAFEKEASVIAQAADGPGKTKLLVADSKGWSKGAGTRIEIQVVVPDQYGRIPMTAYIRSVTDIQTIEGGGNTIHVPVAEPRRNPYWFNPEDGIQVKGPTDTLIAFVKCDKKV